MNDPSTAPKDGTILRLFVDFQDYDRWTPYSDENPSWVVGFNNYECDGEDVWLSAGWNWSQDCFTHTILQPAQILGWLPFYPENTQ